MSATSWPTPQDYNEAIQNPAQNLADSELAAGTAELTPLGLPRPITGNFASVYRLHSPRRDWAVRCFWRNVSDMQLRYAAISRHLKAANLPFTVGFEYQERGIRVQGSWFPILKMEWVQGALLDEFVRQNLTNPNALLQLSRDWLQMVERLEIAGVAHGDLQHGNVLVAGNALRLVDYDGMFVPALKGSQSHELGHENYQHPRRTNRDFGPWLDRFAAAAIYLSLRALSVQPQLWQDLSGGDECLLFRKRDFLVANSSHTFARLAQVPDAEVRRLAGELNKMLKLSPAQLPSPFASPEPRGEGRIRRRNLWRGTAAPVGPAAAVPAGSSLGQSWLFDHIDRPAPLSCGRPPRGARLAGLLPLLVVPLMLGAGIEGMPALWPAEGLLASLILVSVAFLLGAYVSDPAVRRLRASLLIERRAHRNWRASRTLVRRLERRAARLDRGYGRDRRRVEQEIERVKAGLVRQKRILAELRNEVCRSFAERTRELEQREVREREAELQVVRAKHIKSCLRRTRVWSRELRGLSTIQKVKISARGIRCAADADSERIAGCRQLGPQVTEAIVEWRVEAELRARRSLPKTLPERASVRIERRFRRPRRRLERDRSKVGARVDLLGNLIAARAAGRLSAIAGRMTSLCRDHEDDAARAEEMLTAARAAEQQHRETFIRGQGDLLPFHHVTFVRFLLNRARPVHAPAGNSNPKTHNSKRKTHSLKFNPGPNIALRRDKWTRRFSRKPS